MATRVERGGTTPKPRAWAASDGLEDEYDEVERDNSDPTDFGQTRHAP